MLPRRQGTYLEDWNLHTPANWAAVFQRKDDKDQTNWGYVITHLQRHSTIPPHPIIHHEQQKKIFSRKFCQRMESFMYLQEYYWTWDGTSHGLDVFLIINTFFFNTVTPVTCSGLRYKFTWQLTLKRDRKKFTFIGLSSSLWSTSLSALWTLPFYLA